MALAGLLLSQLPADAEIVGLDVTSVCGEGDDPNTLILEVVSGDGGGFSTAVTGLPGNEIIYDRIIFGREEVPVDEKYDETLVQAGDSSEVEDFRRCKAGATTTTEASGPTTTTTLPPGNDQTPKARDITIHACPPGAVPATSFPDVPSDSAHADAIGCVAWYDIARGYADGRFGVGDSVTRGQLATFVSRVLDAAGLAVPADQPDAFQDDNGDTHEAAINRLVQAGVLNGFPDGTFGPAKLVDRGQLATYLARAYEAIAGQELPVGSVTFPDDAGTHQANIRRVAAAGITAGTADGGFQPGQPTRRDQMASFLARTVDVLVEQNFIQLPS